MLKFCLLQWTARDKVRRKHFLAFFYVIAYWFLLSSLHVQGTWLLLLLTLRPVFNKPTCWSVVFLHLHHQRLSDSNSQYLEWSRPSYSFDARGLKRASLLFQNDYCQESRSLGLGLGLSHRAETPLSCHKSLLPPRYDLNWSGHPAAFNANEGFWLVSASGSLLPQCLLPPFSLKVLLAGRKIRSKLWTSINQSFQNNFADFFKCSISTPGLSHLLYSIEKKNEHYWAPTPVTFKLLILLLNFASTLWH